MKFIVSILLFVYLFHAQSANVIPVKDPNNILVTYGSCNKYYGDEPDDIFYKIADMNPDVWIWLGDVAYVDKKIIPPYFAYGGEEFIKEKLHSAKTSPPYAKLRQTTKIIGVWDDHDFGLNNAGKNFAHKDITQQLWLDFMDEPLDSVRRKRKGVYESYYIGDASKIKVILLDVRYFREDSSILKPSGTDILGPEQWAWLEKELKENTAEYVLIGSGVQVLPDDRLIPEHWYAGNRDRLIALIRKYKVNGVLLLSGDVHHAEIMKYPCKEHVGYDLYEFTSSGLTHHVSSHVPLADKYVRTLVPTTYSNNKDRFLDLNFGVLKFSFAGEKGVKAEIRDKDSKVVLDKSLTRENLLFNAAIVNENKACITQRNKYIRFLERFIAALLNGKWYAYLVLLLTFVLLFVLRAILRIPGWILRKLIGGSQHLKKD